MSEQAVLASTSGLLSIRSESFDHVSIVESLHPLAKIEKRGVSSECISNSGLVVIRLKRTRGM